MIRNGWHLVLAVAALAAATLARADEFDTLRLKWRDLLTLGTNVVPADPLYATWTSSIGTTAQRHWNSMATSAGRTYLWSDYSSLGSRSSDITATYERLRAMAMGYAVRGSIVEANPALRTALIGGLDWMYANAYNESKAEFDNWFDWEIGTPLNLNDITVLLYSDLTGARITNYMNAVNQFTPTPDLTGANEVWKASVVAVRGVLVKSSSKLVSARQSLSDVFPYVSSGDGFHEDGSFIFHGNFPYNGGYGAQLIGTIAPLMQLLKGSTWEVMDPQQANLYRWIHDSCAPFIYRGALMQMVDGRYHTRRGDDHLDGADLIASILRVAQLAPPADKAAYLGMVKHWMQSDGYQNFIETQPPPYNLWARDVLTNASITPQPELLRHYQFPHMDRVVHRRPGWALGLSMQSSRIDNYESIRGENLRGWYTAEGMTYLYNGDLAQFADGFWPTVNPYRLPGTTVDTQTRTNGSGQSYASPNNWVGGASLQNLYGVFGMHLNAWNSTLNARKSWFMFDNEVVCLGAGITATDGRTVETIIENRRLAAYGNNRFTVGGAAKPAAVGWSEALVNPAWAHLGGNLPGADIGYYFPTSAVVYAQREARSGSLYDLNTTYGSTNTCTRNYLSLWVDHGISPSNASYAYVLLPNQTADQVAAYAGNPQVTVLENSTRAQGVRESVLGITAVNFWRDGTNRLGGITVDKKASVILRNDGSLLEVGISDPTQTNSGIINLEINVASLRALSLDPGVTLLQASPTLKLAVNANGTSGQALHASFLIGSTQTVTLSPVADAYVQNGDQISANFGSAVSLAAKSSGNNQSRETFLRFELPTSPGVVIHSILRLVPITIEYPMFHALAMVPDNGWSENGISWSNRPGSGPEVTRWLLPTEERAPIFVPVTSLVEQAVAADGRLSLRLYSTGTPPPTNGGYVAYGSRENGSATVRPQLILTLGRRPPTVSLATVGNETSFDAPASVTLAAEAEDPDGSVLSVEFYQGSAKIGQSLSRPFLRPRILPASGQYNFIAVATDNTGLMSTSAPIVITVTDPEPAGRGTGLIGEYYSNSNLTGLALTRIDPSINFSWAGVPGASVPADHFSVRWSGKLQARHAGLHQMRTLSDDGMRVWLDGELVIDHWSGHAVAEDTNSLPLRAGQYYDLRVEYFDSMSNAVAQLSWTLPSGVTEVIPQAQFYPADVGLRGSYYPGTNLVNLAFTRTEDVVNFNWGNGSPDPTLLPGNFSARWTGRVRANQTGVHLFQTLSDDGVRLWVNNQLLINNWTVHPLTENSGAIPLTAGQSYDLTMEYFNIPPASTAVLSWTPPGGVKQVIPAASLAVHQNNSPPVLAPLPAFITTRSNTIGFTAMASDPEIPGGQSLTFRLDADAPAGATIHPVSGLFTWMVPAGQTLGVYPVTVRVTDNGAPSMTDAQTIKLTVTASVASLQIQAAPGGAVITWPADAGAFFLYATTSLSPGSGWTPTTNVPVFSEGRWVVTLPVETNRMQFYRLQSQ